MFVRDPDQLDLFPATCGFGEASHYHDAQAHGFFAHIVKRWHVRAGRRQFGMCQRSHRVSALAYVIEHADPALDNYISQAEFFKPNRRVVNLLRLNLNFLDLDILAVDPRWDGHVPTPQMVGAVLLFCDDEGIPRPTFIIFSGRNLYGKYLHERPLPRQAVTRWNAVQRRLVDLFQRFGADHRAKDASRVLRLMGTTNTKSGKIVRVLHVETEDGQPKRYGFDWLAHEILETGRGTIAENRREAQAKREAARRGQAAVDKQAGTAGLRKFDPRRLAWDRLEDLRKLADLRGWMQSGVPEGHRENYLFWSANFMLSSGATHPGQMFHEVTALAREVCPGSGMDAEVRSSLSTVYRKGLEHLAGGRVEFNGRKYSPLYTPRNETLAEQFQITREEERELQTIISGAEAAERHRKRRLAKLRESGAVNRADYLESAEMKRAEARLMAITGLSPREIAIHLNVSEEAVSTWLA